MENLNRSGDGTYCTLLIAHCSLLIGHLGSAHRRFVERRAVFIWSPNPLPIRSSRGARKLAPAPKPAHHAGVTLSIPTEGCCSAATPRAQRGLDPARSTLLHETSRQHHWHGTGLLSIKVFHGGRAHYDVGCGHY